MTRTTESSLVTARRYSAVRISTTAYRHDKLPSRTTVLPQHSMPLFDNATRWLVFVGVAVAMSYGLRLLAAWATRVAARRLAHARRLLGLPATPAVRLTPSDHDILPREPE